MREMKDSGIEWIGEVPINWDIIRIKDKYAFETGFTPDTAHSEYYNDEFGYEWATIADICEGEIGKPTKNLISRDYVKSMQKMPVKKGALLYSFKLSLGQTAIVDRPIFTNEAIAAFMPSNKVNLKFLKYSSCLIEYGANTNIYGAKILNQQLINDAYIVFPSAKEQKIIADYLDQKCTEINSLSADIEEQISILGEYKKSVITEAVTKGIDPDAEMKDSGIEWIGEIPKYWNVKKTKYNFANTKTISGIKSPEYDRLSLTLKGVIPRAKDDAEGLQPKNFDTYQLLHKGELVFKLIDLQNVSTSRVGLAHDTGIVSPAYIVLCANGEIMPEFAEKYFLMLWHREIFNALGDDGVRSSLNATDLLNIPICYPEYRQQKKIVAFLDSKCAEIDEIIDTKKQQLETLAEYKKSLIYEYVTGKKEIPTEIN